MNKQFLLLFVFFMLPTGQAFLQTVYITKTGKKYHVITCRYLSRSSIAIPLSEAIAAIVHIRTTPVSKSNTLL